MSEQGRESCAPHGLRRPHFLIIGAMKAATTTLHAQLAMQPGIFMSTPKELEFFNDSERFTGGLHAYLSHFAAAAPDALCGESSTSYAKLPTFPGTAARIHAELPQARLIYCVRHPIERLLSHYVHEITCGTIARETRVEEAVKLHPELISYGLYAWQLKPYIELFGWERVLPVFSERLHRYPEPELQRVYRFIGHSGQAAWKAQICPQNVSTERMVNNFLTRFIVRNERFRKIRQRLLPAGIRNAVRRQLCSNIQKPNIRQKFQRELTDIFDADLKTLGDWFGADVSCATFNRWVGMDDAPKWIASA